MSQLADEFDAALRASETGFHVRLIGTFDPELVWAPGDVDATTWLRQNNPDFDQFPVKLDCETLGILLRNGDHCGKTVRDAMQPLRDGLIISADMPIADLIPELRENHCRLILRGGRIDGLVTQSDLVKLPVRMLLFGLISHLELSLRALVRKRASWPIWMDRLDPQQRGQLQGKIEKLKRSRLEPDPLELTNFSDVITVLAAEPDLSGEFQAQMDGIRHLRNDIAHSKTFINSATDVPQFVDRFEQVQEWIGRMKQMLDN